MAALREGAKPSRNQASKESVLAERLFEGVTADNGQPGLVVEVDRHDFGRLGRPARDEYPPLGVDFRPAGKRAVDLRRLHREELERDEVQVPIRAAMRLPLPPGLTGIQPRAEAEFTDGEGLNIRQRSGRPFPARKTWPHSSLPSVWQ